MTVGQCIKCNSENLTYGAIELEGDTVSYPYHCNDCEHEGNEYFDLTYTNSD